MMNKEQLTRIESNIYYLDSRYSDSFNVSGVYIVIGDGLTLIETGTTLIAPLILDAVHEIGYSDIDIKRAIVTHIHLDHAGGTGWLVRQLPHMKVYVHERGLKHLIDPSILIDSARIQYGDLATIMAIHGEILPVPAENLFPVTDDDLDIGNGISMKIINSPGHAPHHLCLFEPESGCLFAGEALGHYQPEEDVISPAVAPPGFNLVDSINTIKKIQGLEPRKICFSQYGQHSDSAFVINESIRQLEFYHGFIKARLKEGMSADQVKEEIVIFLSGRNNADNDITHSMVMSIVRGFQIYYQRIGEIN